MRHDLPMKKTVVASASPMAVEWRQSGERCSFFRSFLMVALLKPQAKEDKTCAVRPPSILALLKALIISNDSWGLLRTQLRFTT